MENQTVDFEEQLRTNSDIDLPEIYAVHTVGELTEIYSVLQDPAFPRSAPIPLFDGNTESMIVLKPKLESMPFGDIEIEEVSLSGSTLTVSYREVPNWEYEEQKWNHPLLIIKIDQKPKKLNLKRIQ